MNTILHIEACDLVGSEEDTELAVGRGDIKNWSYERRVGPWQCVLDAAVIGGRACWIEHRYGRCWFISDRLAAMLQERKLKGFVLDRHRHCDEVSL